jgi:hypothetical protein
MTLCMFASTSQASPITYVEIEDTAGNASTSPTLVGALDIGVNTISGWVTNADPSLSDGYLFTLGAGLVINDVRIIMGATGSGAIRQIALRQDSSNYLTGTLIDELFASGTGLSAGGLGVFPGTPLSSIGQYFIGNGGGGGLAGTDLSYTYQLTVASAPEPTTLTLLALSVLGLGYSRRKQFRIERN